MAKVTFINAILSGKLAGTVYSRNRSGYYLREWVKPINPRSILQILARISFSGATQAYHSLADGLKAVWQSFAQTKFNPKNNIPGLQFSAINAFCALWNNVSNCIRKTASNVTFQISATPVVNAGANVCAFPDIPPEQALQLNQRDSTGKAVPFSCTATSITHTTSSDVIQFGFDMTFLTEIDELLAFSDASPNGLNKFGFSVYLSKPGKQAHNFFPNPASTFIGFVPAFNCAVKKDDVSSIQIAGTAAVLGGECKSFGGDNDWVQVDIYQTSTSGMKNLAGSTRLQIEVV